MACAPGIYSRLPMTSPPGGVWFYVGYSATVGGPYTGTPANPIGNLTPNTNLQTWGYDFVLDTEGRTPGYYRFTYTYIGGNDTVTIEVQSDAICAGSNFGLSIEQGTVGSVNLFTFLASPACPSPQSGGTWTNINGAPGFNTSTGVLNQALPTAGQYQFQYKIAALDELGCDTCSTSAIVTLVVDPPATLNATITKTDVACTYTLNIYNPVTNVIDNVYCSVMPDSYGPTVKYRAKVTNCDNVVVYQNDVTVVDAIKPVTSVHTDTMNTGGYMSQLKLSSNLGVDILVPLEPGNATYTGPGGTTNATELTFNSASPIIFFAAVRKATINYLAGLGYVQGVDFDMMMPVFNPSLPSSVEIRFGIKHNPTSRWIGYSITSGQIIYYTQPFAIRSTLQGGITCVNLALTESFSLLPCMAGGNALMKQITAFWYNIISTCDYNLITLYGSDRSVTTTGTNSRSCTDKLLTANPTGCSGSLTYLWDTAATTQAVKVPNIPGVTHNVQVSCTAPASSVTKSTTL